MQKLITVAVLGSTGYVGQELVYILSKHPYVDIKFLGSDSNKGKEIVFFDKRIKNKKIPILDLNSNLDPSSVDLVFLCLPHGISHKFVKDYINKSFIIDLSADFRINDIKIYKKNYKEIHSCPQHLNKFTYGLSEVNFKLILQSTNIAVPGCYPTSVLLPLIPLLKNSFIRSNNIIIDSKSGYSGAGKKFDKKNIFNNDIFNFYNYNTNQHHHIDEISYQLSKYSSSEIKFSFNPHILPIFRGMMSTIYCDLKKNITNKDIKKCLKNFYLNSQYIQIIEDENRLDFFRIQNTNNCFIKLFNHYDKSKIIIVSLIDNLLKGASGQAVQCMNIKFGFDENIGLNIFNEK